MITKHKDYDSTTAFGMGGFKSLPKGGYITRILQAEEMADRNGNPMVHIAFDIIDGEYTGYFMNLYQSRKRASDDPMNVKFPFEGQMWIAVNDWQDPNKTSRKFKGFCTALEDSGTEVWDARGNFLLANLKNAEVGIIFQDVENEYEGKTSWRAVPWGCRSVSAIESNDYFVPDDKPLPPQKQNTGFNNFSTPNPNLDSFAQAEDDLPF